MNKNTITRLTGLLLAVAAYQISASSALAANPGLDHQQKPPQDAVNSSTAPPYSITQQGESAAREVDQFKQKAEGSVTQATSAITQVFQSATSVMTWLKVQVEWVGAQFEELSRALPQQSTK